MGKNLCDLFTGLSLQMACSENGFKFNPFYIGGKYMNFEFFVPTHILIGPGKLNELSKVKLPGKKATVYLTKMALLDIAVKRKKFLLLMIKRKAAVFLCFFYSL